MTHRSPIPLLPSARLPGVLALLLVLLCGAPGAAAQEGDGGTVWLLDTGRASEPTVAVGVRPAFIDFDPVAAIANQFMPEGEALARRLIAAAESGDLEAVRQAVSASGRPGARLNAEDDEGRTPLYWTLFYDDEKIARTLFDNGARLGRLIVELPQALR